MKKIDELLQEVLLTMTELLSPRDFSGVATMSEVVIFYDDIILRIASCKLLQGNPAARRCMLSVEPLCFNFNNCYYEVNMPNSDTNL